MRKIANGKKPIKSSSESIGELLTSSCSPQDRLKNDTSFVHVAWFEHAFWWRPVWPIMWLIPHPWAQRKSEIGQNQVRRCGAVFQCDSETYSRSEIGAILHSAHPKTLKLKKHGSVSIINKNHLHTLRAALESRDQRDQSAIEFIAIGPVFVKLRALAFSVSQKRNFFFLPNDTRNSRDARMSSKHGDLKHFSTENPKTNSETRKCFFFHF